MPYAPRRTRTRSFLTIALGAILSVSFLAACGDDDDATPEEAFCDAGDSLEANVQALGDLDIVAEGTDGLEEQLGVIESDLTAMMEAGTEVAGEPIAELETAVTDLETSLDELGGDLTVDNASAAIDAVSRIVTSAQAVYTELASTCP
jgi:hypothetical protein